MTPKQKQIAINVLRNEARESRELASAGRTIAADPCYSPKERRNARVDALHESERSRALFAAARDMESRR
jgi:hypothetical protein